MSDIDRLRAVVRGLIKSILEMEAYNDVPPTRKDPVWQSIRRRGAEALKAARCAEPVPSYAFWLGRDG